METRRFARKHTRCPTSGISTTEAYVRPEAGSSNLSCIALGLPNFFQMVSIFDLERKDVLHEIID